MKFILWPAIVLSSFSLQILTYGRRIPVAELFARIDAVDASTVKRVANRFIFDQVKSSHFFMIQFIVIN